MLGPEMKSTGEVMGIDLSFGLAFYKSQLSANQMLPDSGIVFVSVGGNKKRDMVFPAKQLCSMGFQILATDGTYKVFKSNNIDAKIVNKIGEGKPALQIIQGGAGQAIKLVMPPGQGQHGLRLNGSFQMHMKLGLGHGLDKIDEWLINTILRHRPNSSYKIELLECGLQSASRGAD